MDCADTGVELARDSQLYRLRHSRQESVQVLLELDLRHIRARHCESVGVDDDGELSSPKRQAEAHQV
ncbi:unnamed protein product, partial [Schistocephalus solidus]|uniref:FHA domain-containing protein n=1 Tax=Schistocephalus solidus TaxID=70667 RepID=A0A183SAS6_SCHSO